MRCLLVGVRQRKHSGISPGAPEKRHTKWITAADESSGNSHLRESGDRTLLACARLAAVPFQSALVGVRTREIGRIQQRIQTVALHQANEEIAEGLAGGVERPDCLAQRISG